MIKKLYKFISILIIGLLLFSSLPTYAYSQNNGIIQDENNDSIFRSSNDIDPSAQDNDWYYKPNSYNELVSWYQDLEDRYPDYIHVFKANELYNTGQAVGGYDLYYVRITNESHGFHKPEVFFSGGPHGDETVGAIGMYWFLEWFTRKALTDEPSQEYSKDWLNWILDNREIYFEISHNPYGFDNNLRYDANGWDLNREADYDGPGSPTGGIWASEPGKTLYRFINNHTIRVGCDFHGGIRLLLYPWAGTHTSIHGTSPISGERYYAAPPDFNFYDVSTLRLGAYMGNPGGDGYLDETNIGTIHSLIWYLVQGGIAPWAYGGNGRKNLAEAYFVQGNYPGAGILWITPEMSIRKNPSESTFGNDTTPGWGWEVRRFILHQTDLAQPYVRWQKDTSESQRTVYTGEPFSLQWQVNGSLVVDHTFIQYGSDPDPINNYDVTTPDNDENAGNYIGGTGWDDAEDGHTNAVIYSENISILTPGEYYFVAKAKVDQIYGSVLAPNVYGNESYLRLVNERTNASYYESLDGTDGLEEIRGREWWYSEIIKVTVEMSVPEVSFDQPKPSTIYLNNAELELGSWPFQTPILIGDIDIKVNAWDPGYSGIDYVEIFINDESKAMLGNAPYVWNWIDSGFGSYTIRADAFDKAGASESIELTVIKLF